MEKVKRYKINEIFYSLQGEGRWTGRAAIFIRFAGCNLKCPFCDTDHKPLFRYTMVELLGVIKSYDSNFIVLTGGEPSMQIDKGLIDYLHAQGYYIAIETNGTKELPDGIDWITVSPKDLFVKRADVVITKCNELKVVFDGLNSELEYDIEAEYKYIQPCDTGDVERNRHIIDECVEFIKDNPDWQLSLQTQKIINVR